MSTLTYSQNSFSGGMNMVLPPTKLMADQYILGVNIRTRYGKAEQVVAPLEVMEGLPAGLTKNQGIYAFGNILVLFVDNLAFYKEESDDAWTPISGFDFGLIKQDRIYATAVPASSRQYLRKAVDATKPSSGVTLSTDIVTGSEVALVVQDGVNQPYLIFSDGTCRLAKTFLEWSSADREYVPIGRQMIYSSGILFVVSADGKSIYRSVSGRPLDFVVAVDAAGFRVADASVTSFAVDNNEIKLIDSLNSDSLTVITAYAAYSVSLDFDNLLYGEPQFSQVFLFKAGTLNQFCATDILGDYAFIDREGLKSFNAVSQLKFEGNNSVFSQSVAKLFKGLLQVDPCVGSFDNYTFFSVRTRYSPATILVFDNLNKIFVSADILGIGAIKQFASTYTDSRQRFFACTVNKIYELYSTEQDPGDISSVIFTRELESRNSDYGPAVSPQGIQNIKSTAIRVIFEDSLQEGEVVVRELSNNNPGSKTYSRDLPEVQTSFVYPLTLPMMANVIDSIVPLDIPIRGNEGQQIGYVISWSGGASLNELITYAETSSKPTSRQQQSRIAA